MNIDTDKLKRKPNLEALSSCLDDVTTRIEEINEAIEIATDPEEERDVREDARVTIADALDQLFEEVEALQTLCKRLSA